MAEGQTTMEYGTYSVPTKSDGALLVCTRSQKGIRGWLFTYIADDPETDYAVYEYVTSFRWSEPFDPDEADYPTELDTAEEVRADPTRAVADYMAEYAILGAVEQGINSKEYRFIGADRNNDAKDILFRTLLRSENRTV